jgi:DNA replication protein DnaC
VTRATVTAREPSAIGDAPLVEVLATIDCPTCGKRRAGKRVRFVGSLEVDNSCEDCCKRAEREREEEERRERAAQLRANAGETPRLAELTLDTYPKDDAAQAAMEAALRWRDGVLSKERSAPRNLFLFGERGSGKTGLLWPIAASLCDHLIETKFVDFPTLLEEMKDSYAHKVPMNMTDLVRVPVLVLDDLGAERPTEWAVSQLLHLVNQRYERLLYTAFASNFKPGDLARRLGRDDEVAGNRILSRIIESCIQHRMRAGDRRVSSPNPG